MKVSDFFKRLSYGELSNLSIGSEGAGAIDPAKQNKIIHYTNEGLLRLHSRFLLIENDVLIEQQDWLTSYKLDYAHALSNDALTDDDVIFINDLGAPFKNDVIKILAVYDGRGVAFPLNDTGDPCSLFTPTPETLQVPNPIQGVELDVLYQARHPELPYDTLETEINIPSILEPALAKYVGYLTYSHMNGQEHAAKASEHLSVYESICAEIEKNDLVNSSSSTTTTRFEKGGFV